MTTMKPGTQTVLPLTAATDYHIAGRKPATLAHLAAHGFPVTPRASSCRLPSSSRRSTATSRSRPTPQQT
jgi:hypothetical protein